MQTRQCHNFKKAYNFAFKLVSTPYLLLIPLIFIKLIPVRYHAEPRTQPCRLKVQVTVEGHGIEPGILCIIFLSTPYLLNHMKVFFVKL